MAETLIALLGLEREGEREKEIERDKKRQRETERDRERQRERLKEEWNQIYSPSANDLGSSRCSK